MEQGIGLGASARVRRGFNRAGVALAALVAVIGLCAALWDAVDKLDREYAFRIQAECLKPKLDKLYSTLPKGFALEQIRTSEHGCIVLPPNFLAGSFFSRMSLKTVVMEQPTFAATSSIPKLTRSIMSLCR